MAIVRINTGDSDSKESLAPVVEKYDVIVQKKSLSTKFADAFISDAAKDIGNYILMDVIVPGIKDTIMNCISMVFYGNASGRRSSYNRSSDNTSYRAFYQSEYDSYGAPRRRERRDDRRRYRDEGYGRDRIDYRNIIIRDRSAAEEIVSRLRGRIEKYGEATKSDLFELIDVSSSSVDNNWGWTNPRDIGLRRVSTGYLIDVADAEYLED